MGKTNKSKKLNILYAANYINIGIFALLCLIPMLLVTSISITSDAAISKFGYQLIPKEFSLDAYKMIFSPRSSIRPAYGISLSVTFIGTIVATLITGMTAFTVSNKNVYYRNSLALFFFIPMVFYAGLVPWYLMCTKLGLRDNIFALIIPTLLFSPYNMFLCRNYMKSLPDAIMESAKIDGATEVTILFRIYFPLSKPILATIALFYGIAYWNDWFNAIMLIEKRELFPLQYMLYEIKSEIEALQHLQPEVALRDLPTESLKMATAIATIGPIIFLYPYLQRYFIKGIVIGGVKG